jgi:hypothetical protein
MSKDLFFEMADAEQFDYEQFLNYHLTTNPNENINNNKINYDSAGKSVERD